MDSSLQESNTIIQKDKEVIEETPLELNIPCPNHPEENILRLCIDSNTEKEILCVECLINLEDPQSLGKNLVSPGEFINIANEFYQKAEKNVSDAAEAPAEYTNLLLKQAENIEKVSSHIEKEKKKIELRFKTLIQEFSELCNKKMDEYLGQMDKQLFNFRYNYVYFEKQLNKVYPTDKEENVPLYPSKEALTEKFQKVTNSTQLMTLVKNIKQDLKEANFNPSNSQESIEEVRKKNLETLVKTLQKQVTDLPVVSPSKDSTEAQTIKSLKESLEKSLSKLFEFEHEISDLTKGESAPNSKILTTPEQLSLLKNWLNRDVMNLKLLYRASKDGFTGTAFHQKCDGHADTITLIKAEGTNKIFGGYLDKSWETKEAWINSDKTFVFSLTSKEKYTIKVGHEMYAAYAGSSYGPSFGGGYDFHISGKSGGALLYSFEITDLNNFTGGSSFTCAEIEVFQITKGSGVSGGAEKSTSSGSIPKEAKTKVAEHLGIDVSKFKLLYKGSDDGMTPENFHEKCDNKGPTVVFVKTKGSDDIIGGYTTQPWCAKENYALDNDAFVFSIERNLFCPVAIAESAIFQSGATGPYFGDDETLIIFKEKVSGNYNVIVNAYDCYQDGETFSNKGNTFEPEEVEVYEVSK